MTFPSVKLHACLSKFKACSVNTVSGRNPSVGKFVKGVMLSAVQFHDFPRAAVLYKKSKAARETCMLGRIIAEQKASWFSNKWEFLLITWDYSRFATRTLGFTKLVYQSFFSPLSGAWVMFACSISDERLEVGVGHCLPNLVKWQWLQSTGLNEGDYMHTVFILWSREGLCGESRDLGGAACVCRILLLASYCCVWGCTYTIRPHIKAQTVHLCGIVLWGTHPPSSRREMWLESTRSSTQSA